MTGELTLVAESMAYAIAIAAICASAVLAWYFNL